MMRRLADECRLVFRHRLALLALVLLLGLTGVASWSGVREVARQRDTIARLAPLHERDIELLSRRFVKPGDPGDAAYYTFFNTWDAPSTSAFLALGLRDAAPYVFRVRALGLQAQIYEGEQANPELVLPGRFDFAFVLIYLAPLFVIALLHDLISGEREAGRLRMLEALPGSFVGLSLRRASVRLALVFLALGLPLTLAAWWSGTPPLIVGAVLAATAAYLLIWTMLALFVGAQGWSSAANATALVGLWAILTLALPALANIVLNRAIPVAQGTELMLAQREHVHGAWERPREATMTAFYRTHPEWKDSPPLPKDFHYKWYFAFHQVGDESVAEQVAAYRAGLEARQRWTTRLGWVLPGVGAQSALHRLAATDLEAHLEYEDQIAAFHQQIRRFFYGYMFTDTPFSQADFAKAPTFEARPASRRGSAFDLTVLIVMASVLAAVTVRALRSAHAS